MRRGDQGALIGETAEGSVPHGDGHRRIHVVGEGHLGMRRLHGGAVDDVTDEDDLLPMAAQPVEGAVPIGGPELLLKEGLWPPLRGAKG